MCMHMYSLLLYILFVFSTGCFEIPLSCLKPPNASRCLREPDRVFIDSLKKEMQDNPTTLVSPIVGLVSLNSGDEYDNRHPNSYEYETIGGNNSRIALQELSAQFPNNQCFKTRLVAVYVGLSDDDALRLASKHNRATSFTHSMTTQDKVRSLWLYFVSALFVINLRNIVVVFHCHECYVYSVHVSSLWKVTTCRQKYSTAVEKSQWRKQCSTMLCESVSTCYCVHN